MEQRVLKTTRDHRNKSMIVVPLSQASFQLKKDQNNGNNLLNYGNRTARNYNRESVLSHRKRPIPLYTKNIKNKTQK